MLNNHDVICLIENYLDNVGVEYQSVENKIEIYQLQKEIIVANIDQNIFSISHNENKYDFEKIEEFLVKLDELIN